MSPIIENYLQKAAVPFEILAHPKTRHSLQTARSAHVAPTELAKAVIVRDRERYLMCVIPSSNMLVMNWIDREFKGHFQLVNETELAKLLPECEAGAVPAIGEAFHLQVICDRALMHTDEVYFEAGDHRHLIHLHQVDFQKLMIHANMTTISCAAEAMEMYRNIH